MIVSAKKEYAKEMGELHYKYVKSLLRDFGKRMCIVFYEAILHSDNCFGFVYLEEYRVVGFVLGTRDNSQMFNSYRIYLELMYALCKKPLLFKRILFHLINKFAPAPELAYIAVDPEYRGRGIGEQLLRRQHEEFKKRQLSYYEVKIDNDNLPSLALHKKLGAKVKEGFWEGKIYRLRLQIDVQELE